MTQDSPQRIKLSLAHSPDADDLVMWWPLTGITDPSGTPIDGPLGSPIIDTQGFGFDLVARDVEELNQAAIDGASPYDITAISCGAYPKLAKEYRITRSGASFGENYGPKIVVREDAAFQSLEELVEHNPRVVVPGLNTSAALTLRLIAPELELEPMLFSEIPEAVASGSYDAGLLIHEAQLTFQDSGLRELGDLGQWWHTNHDREPLPLGLNVIARKLDDEHGAGTCETVSSILGASIRAAVEHRDASRQYLQLNQGTRTEWNDDALVDRYLDMYVSALTVDMGERGQRAIERFLSMGVQRGFIPDPGPIDLV